MRFILCVEKNNILQTLYDFMARIKNIIVLVKLDICISLLPTFFFIVNTSLVAIVIILTLEKRILISRFKVSIIQLRYG